MKQRKADTAMGSRGLLHGYRQGGPVRPRPGATLYQLGLGSNLGDRRAHLEAAVAFLGECGRVLKRSAIYETAALGMPGSGPFLNMALALDSSLAPLELLARCKAYEAARGRDPGNSHYRDRAIDIDILLAGDLVLATPRLTVPHPEIARRPFVLVPLFEIAPRLVHPLEKVTVAKLVSRLNSSERIVRVE